MRRDQALDHVKSLTTGDRNLTHGDPVSQFQRAQNIKDAVGHRGHPDLTPAEIECIEQICTKLSRWVSGKRGQTTVEKWAEHSLDIIGYASIAVEAIYASEPAPKTNSILARAEADPLLELRARAGVNRPAPNPRNGNDKADPPSAA